MARKKKEPAADGAPAPKAEIKHKPDMEGRLLIRLLVKYGDHPAGKTVALPAEEVAAILAAGSGDVSPEAIAAGQE